jgi:biotin carboxyl carrier protein
MMLLIVIDGRTRQLELTANGTPGQYAATLDGESIELQAEMLQPGILLILIGDRAYRCVLEENKDETAVQIGGRRFSYAVEDPRSLRSRRGHRGNAEGPLTIKAPMPGRVVRMLAEPGQYVTVNQGIIVIEAMKMQNELKAPKAGHVAEIRVTAGETVGVGQVLVIIE